MKFSHRSGVASEAVGGRFGLGLRLCLALLLAACGPAANQNPAPLTGGLEVQALLGPACPVMRSDEPCPDKPFQARVSVLNPDGSQAAEFETDPDGRFRQALPAGTYHVVGRPLTENAMIRPVEVDVIVPQSQFVEVKLTFDSGIR